MCDIKKALEEKIQKIRGEIRDTNTSLDSKQERMEELELSVGNLESCMQDIESDLRDKQEDLSELIAELKKITPSKHKDKSYVLTIPYGADISINYGNQHHSKMWHVLQYCQRRKSVLSKMGLKCKLVENEELEKEKN